MLLGRSQVVSVEGKQQCKDDGGLVHPAELHVYDIYKWVLL